GRGSRTPGATARQPGRPTFARQDETGAAAVIATDLCARRYAQATTAPSDAVPLVRKNRPRKSNTGSSSPPIAAALAQPRPMPTVRMAAVVVRQGAATISWLNRLRVEPWMPTVDIEIVYASAATSISGVEASAARPAAHTT